MDLRRRSLGTAALAAVACRASATPVLRYPAPESPRDKRYLDLVALVEAALRRTEARHGPMHLQPSRSGMSPARRMAELEPGSGSLDLIWLPAATAQSAGLLAVPIDTRRGLLGLRIALIHAGRQAEFAKLRQLSELRRLRVGQGATWADGEVYRQQQIEVVSGGSYEGLFRMLIAGRFDLFPRGVNEVFDEWDSRRQELPELAVESSLLLHYPWPYYIHVSPALPVAERIETGLRAMLADGSFDAHLWRHHGAAVRRAGLARRHAIALGGSKQLAADLAFWRAPPREL